MPIPGSCHCGGTGFEIEGEIPEKLSRRTRSFCARRGALYACYAPRQFKLTTAADNVATCRWNTKLVRCSPSSWCRRFLWCCSRPRRGGLRGRAGLRIRMTAYMIETAGGSDQRQRSDS
jgi:hypothetical protein